MIKMIKQLIDHLARVRGKKALVCVLIPRRGHHRGWLAKFNERQKRQKRHKRHKPPSHVPACRVFADWGRFCPKFLRADFDRQDVALHTSRTGPYMVGGSQFLASPPLVDFARGGPSFTWSVREIQTGRYLRLSTTDWLTSRL
jgi:hypothetical protein